MIDVIWNAFAVVGIASCLVSATIFALEHVSDRVFDFLTRPLCWLEFHAWEYGDHECLRCGKDLRKP
jgi:hypothetical protein